MLGSSIASSTLAALELVGLTRLMSITKGSPDVRIGLIDGPVEITHPDLNSSLIREVIGPLGAACSRSDSFACTHGTFVAGMLCAKPDSSAPGICPGCTLLLRPIFVEKATDAEIPGAASSELASAIVNCVDAGASTLNLSVALHDSSPRAEREVQDALDFAASRSVIVVTAAGNQGTVGSSAITRHPWVIPVAACNLNGMPLSISNLGNSIGRRGLAAPGERITSLGAGNGPITMDGTSVAAPFVTATVALLLSLFPAMPAQTRLAVTHSVATQRRAITPPLLNAWAAYQVLDRQRQS